MCHVTCVAIGSVHSCRETLSIRKNGPIRELRWNGTGQLFFNTVSCVWLSFEANIFKIWSTLNFLGSFCIGTVITKETKEPKQ